MNLTRRTFGKLAAGSAAALALPSCSREATVELLPGAIDTHIHIMGPLAKYPYAENRVYSPPEANVADLQELRGRIGVARNVIVTPSVYGFDNSCTTDAIAELAGTVQGVAVLPPDVTDEELIRLEMAGIRGARLNTGNPALAETLNTFAPKFRGLDWHVQLVGQIDVIVSLSSQLAGLGHPIVLDHFGGARAEEGVEANSFQALIGLLAAGNIYVKLSAPYDRTKNPDYPEMTAFARALIEARPDRMLWGTNWPHPGQDRSIPITETSPYQTIDNAKLATRLTEWCPDAATRKMILVDTPAQLYRFA